MPDSLRRFKAEIFQGLAHPTRIAIVEALRDGELSASEILERLPIEQANLSQHLAVLRSKQIVNHRKSGNQVLYSIKAPVLVEVLDLLKQFFHAHLSQTRNMLEEIEKEELHPSEH
jgi:DNA-binding transcriptional ArsR family regulator